MGYKMPIVCKELNLPIPANPLTLKEYQAEYGIDLARFITLEKDGSDHVSINFHAPLNTKLNLVAPAEFIDDYTDMYPMVHEITHSNIITSWEEGVSNASTNLLYTNNDNESVYGLSFVINFTDSPNLENIKVGLTSGM